MDKIIHEYIRGTSHGWQFGEKTRETRLRWLGRVRRKDNGCIGRSILRMELSGKRKRIGVNIGRKLTLFSAIPLSRFSLKMSRFFLRISSWKKCALCALQTTRQPASSAQQS